LLGNLVDNAIRYTPPHGQIDVAIRQTQTEILLEVSDTGPGILSRNASAYWNASIVAVILA
jgi:signal transduction histidine kinase